MATYSRALIVIVDRIIVAVPPSPRAPRPLVQGTRALCVA